MFGEEFVEQRERGTRVDGGAFAEGVGPAGLDGGLEVVAHAAGDLVAEGLPGEDLRDAVLGTGRDEGMAEHVRVRAGDPYARSVGEAPQAPGGGVAVHPGAAAVEEDRPAIPCAGRPVGRPAYSWWQWDQDHLGAFAAHAQHAVAVFSPRSVMSAPVASKIRKPSSPSMATRAKSYGQHRPTLAA